MPIISNTYLTNQQIGQLLQHEKPELSLWDRFKDLFRAETKRSKVEALFAKMQAPGENSSTYLDNFEALVAEAKPEELHRFRVVVQRGEPLVLRLKIDADEIAAAALPHEGGKFERLRIYAALHELRAAAADTRPNRGLSSHVPVGELHEVIGDCLGDEPHIRRRYGALVRGLEAGIRQDQAIGHSGKEEPADPPALTLLKRIDTGLEHDCPRAVVRDLLDRLILAERVAEAESSPNDPRYEQLRDYTLAVNAEHARRGVEPPAAPPADPIKLQELYDRDADFQKLPIGKLLEFREKHPVQVQLQGLSVRTLLDEEADFTDVDFKKLKELEISRDISLTEVCLGELVENHVKGGGHPIFCRSEQGEWRASLPLHQAGKPIKLPSVLEAGFTVKDVPLGKLAEEFDLEYLPARYLLAPEVDLSQSTLEDLVALKINLENVKAGDLARRGLSFGEYTLGELARHVELAGADLALLIERGMSVQGLKFAKLLPESPQAPAADAADRSNLNLNLKSLSVHTLIAGEADLTGVSVKRLKDAGASFEEVTYQTLQSKHCDFSELTAADIKDFGEHFFDGIGVGDLLGSNLLDGCQLKDLLERGATLDGVSVEKLLSEGVGFDGLSFDGLHGKADFTGVPWKTLRDSGLDVRGAPFAALYAAHVSFANLAFAELTEHLPKKLLGGASEAEMSFFRGTQLTQLVAAQVNLFVENQGISALKLKPLIELGVRLEGASMQQLHDPNLRLDKRMVLLEGLDMKQLRKAGVELRFFEGFQWSDVENSGLAKGLAEHATLAELIKAGISFKGATPAYLGKPLRGLFSGTVSAEERKFFGGMSVAVLIDAKLHLEGSQLKELIDSGIGIDGVDVAKLLDKKVGLKGLKFDDLDKRGAKFTGTSLPQLMRSGLDMAALSFGKLRTHDISFKDVKVDQLPPHFSFYADTGSDPQAGGKPKETPMADLLDAGLDLSGSSPKDLLARGAAIDARSVDALLERNIRLDGLRLSQLDPEARAALVKRDATYLLSMGVELDHRMNLQGLKFAELLPKSPQAPAADALDRSNLNLNLKNLSVKTLLDGEADLEGVPVKQLKDAGASFGKVTYQALRGRRCDFNELTAADIKDFDEHFFDGIGAGDLLGSDLLRGCQLKDLLDRGATLDGVSVEQLLSKQVRFDGLSFADMNGKADFTGAPWKALRDSGLDVRSAPFAALHAAHVSFANLAFAELTGHLPKNLMGEVSEALGRVSEAEKSFFQGTELTQLVEAQVNLFVEDQGTCELKLKPLIERGVGLKGASITQLVHDRNPNRVDRLLSLEGLDMKQLRKAGMELQFFGGVPWSALENYGLAKELAQQWPLAQLIEAGISFEGVTPAELGKPLRGLLSGTVSDEEKKFFGGISVTALMGARLRLEGAQLKELMASGIGIDGVDVAKLLDAKLELSGLSPKDLLARGATIDARSVDALLRKQIRLDGLRFSQLDPEARAVLVQVQHATYLRHMGVELDATFAELRKAGSQLHGVDVAWLLNHVGKIKDPDVPTKKDVFGGASLQDLLEAKVKLSIDASKPLQLQPLLDQGLTIGKTSIAQLVALGIRLDGLTFDRLADELHADFGGISILDLQKAGLDLKGAQFSKLRDRVSFNGVHFNSLHEGIRYDKCVEKELKAAGLQYNTSWHIPALKLRGLVIEERKVPGGSLVNGSSTVAPQSTTR